MSNVHTPFIPPLNTPAAQRTPLPTEPPVIPTGPPAGPPPGWGAAAQYPGAFPQYQYPRTPYTASIPPNLPHTPGAQPGPYLSPHPASAYIAGHPGHALDPHPRDPGLSADWIGFQNLPQNSMGAPPVAPAHPQTTPWGPMSAPLPGQQGGGWFGPRQPYPAFGPPMSAGPYGPFPLPQQGWGPPVGPPPPHVTPAHYPMNLDPYGGMTWAMQNQAQMGVPAHQQYPPMHVPPHMMGPALVQVGDRMDAFTAGRNYGPVLEPFLLKVVGAKVRVNPLLEPVPDNGADRAHLKWNMLFKTNACQRSTDPPHISWSKGRDDPATFPRVTKINLVSEVFPWMVTVHAMDRDVGVTCGELIDGLSDDLHKLTSAADYNTAPDAKKRMIGESYRHNRSRVSGVPGGRLGEGLRRMDFLGRDAVFGGVVDDERLVKRLVGEVLPATFVLRCVRQYALTPEELREHELRERAGEEREGRRARVETESESADDE